MPKDYVAKQFDFKGLRCASWAAPDETVSSEVPSKRGDKFSLD